MEFVLYAKYKGLQNKMSLINEKDYNHHITEAQAFTKICPYRKDENCCASQCMKWAWQIDEENRVVIRTNKGTCIA